jgi:protein translocase SecG subunit
MNQFLFYAQIIISVILIILIAVQQKGTALGSAFGGSGTGEFYSSKRGAQKRLHHATIIATTLFLILGVVNILF